MMAMAAVALAGIQDSRAQAAPASPAQSGTATAKSAPVKEPGNNSVQKTVKPLWKDLTPGQREALTPLEADWDGFPSDRKQKWLEVAAKYPRMSPEGQQRLHERMGALARMTPEQRHTTRENFKKAYELPLEQRQQALQQYQELPDYKKKELAAKAREKSARKVEPPRRANRERKISKSESEKGVAKEPGAAK